MDDAERETVQLLGVRIDTVGTQGLYDRVMRFIESGVPRKVMYVNADCMLLSRTDPAYREVLNRADLVYADGIGVVLGARVHRRRIQERSTGADFLPEFCRGFAERGCRIYCLGARPGIADLAVRRLQAAIPELKIVGIRHGYFSPDELEDVLAAIRRAAPDVLLVGMGAPRQERWIDEHAEELGVPVLWGVGGAFDFLSGRTPRGPKLLVDHGFEWLCRLAIEPKRLWRRYLLGNTKFLWHVLSERFADRPAK